MGDRIEDRLPQHNKSNDSDPFAEFRIGGSNKALGKLSDKGSEGFEILSFGPTQKIQLGPGESGDELHERLSSIALNGFQTVRHPTQIDTHSWYTFDASKILGIKDAVAVVTSTCKHETPYKVFVGVAGHDWEQRGRLPSGEPGYRYRLRDLGRDLTEQEKRAIYDAM